MEKLRNRLASLKEQSGINMVDLMMWLVIAALLLAAALQGIGYYQKAAYLNNMKSDAHNAGTNAFAVAASNDGVVDTSVLNTAVTDTKWSDEVLYSVESPSETSRSPYIRVSHPAVLDQEVIYLFDSCGEEYAVGSNVIPKGGTPVLEACGITTAAPGGGGSSDPNTVSWTNQDNAAASQRMVDRMNAYLTLFQNEDFWALHNGTATNEQMNALVASDEYRIASTPMPDVTVNETNLRHYLTLNDPTGYQTIKDQMAVAETNFQNWADATTAQAMVDAAKAEFDAMLAVSLPDYGDLTATVANPSGFQDKFVTAGGTGLETFAVAVPAGVDPNAVPRTFQIFRSDSTGGGSSAGSDVPSNRIATSDGQGGYYIQDEGQYDTTGWDPAYTYKAMITIETPDGYQHYKVFNITVQ